MTTLRPIALAGLALAMSAATTAGASDYPSQPIHIIVPYAPGGPVDFVGRNVSEALRRNTDHAFVVENRPGAGGVTGTESVINARPDGYEVVIGSAGPLVVRPSAGAVNFDPQEALAPVALLGSSPQILVVYPGVEARTVAEFAELARQRPGELNIGSAGIGTTPHLAAELLMKEAGIELTHIPYRGTGQAIPDLLGGQIDAIFGDISAVLPLIEDGRLTALAITSAERSDLAPDIETTAEAGFPTLISGNWQGFFMPAGTPEDRIEMLADAVRALHDDPAFMAVMRGQGVMVPESSPEHLADFLAAELALWGPIIAELDLDL